MFFEFLLTVFQHLGVGQLQKPLKAVKREFTVRNFSPSHDDEAEGDDNNVTLLMQRVSMSP